MNSLENITCTGHTAFHELYPMRVTCRPASIIDTGIPDSLLVPCLAEMDLHLKV